jgi:uncharacterized DUF497 family protein
MDFTWHTSKARRNLTKHGISFDEASTVFGDVLSVSGPDPDHSSGEYRFVTFGLSSAGRLLAVFHTETRGIIRIISARKMTSVERRLYEEG